PSPQTSIRDELATLALLAEAEILNRLDDGNGERVVDRRVINVTGRNAGLSERARSRPARPGIRQVDPPIVEVLGRFTVAHDLHLRTVHLPSNLRAGHDHGPAAIVHHATIEPMQWIAQHWRAQHFFDGYWLLEQRTRVVLGMLGGRHFDPRQLLAR